jgi:hypothetical protein
MGVYFELMTVIRGIIYFSSPVKILSLQEYSSFFLSLLNIISFQIQGSLWFTANLVPCGFMSDSFNGNVDSGKIYQEAQGGSNSEDKNSKYMALYDVILTSKSL